MVMKDYEAEAEAQRKEAERAQRLRDNNINDAVKALLAAKNGRDFLWWLLEIGKYGSQPFAREARFTDFGCGELNVGLQVFDRIVNVNPEGYLRMLKEKQDDARREQLTGTGDASGLASERGATDDA